MAAAEEVSAHWGANSDHPGLFQILLNVKTMSTVEAIKAIREEIERMRTAEVTDEELKSARDRALDSLAFASDSGAKALTRALSYEYFGYPADFLQQHQNALAGVTRAAVLRAAKEHLDPAKLIAVTVGQPEDFGPGLEALGAPVNKIDIAIAPPKREAAPSDAASQAQGKAYIERMQQAAGGVDKLAAVKDATQAAEFQLIAPGGGRVKVTQRWLASGAIRQESESSAGWVKVFWDGKYGWMATPRETAVLNGPLLKQIRGDLFRMYYSLLLSDRLAGRTVNAVDNGTVEISDPSGEVVRIVCDPESGLPSRLLFESVNAAGPSVSVSEQFSDFRDVAGVRVPYKMTITQGGQKFADMVVTDLRVNTGIKVEELQKRP